MSQSPVVELDARPKDALALPEQVVRRGLTFAQWNTLCKSLFPGANPNSVLLVVDYCAARKLDPLKKPCHIVPMEVKDAKTGAFEWRDVVMPGIYEHRTTAQRTGQYLGHSRPEYGPEVEVYGVQAPEWCSLTVYRWNQLAGIKVEFPVTVYFKEAIALTRDKQAGGWKANSRWSRAPIQMLTKCCEAAGLREAFPDELGGEQTAEEMDGQRAIDVAAVQPSKPLPPKPDGYDDWLGDLVSTADEGLSSLEAAWQQSAPERRQYLTAGSPEAWESLKRKAANAGTTDGETLT